MPCLLVMWDGCGGSMPKRGQEMVCNRVSHRCLLRRLHQERSRGHQMVPREPSDIARIGMLGAKRELLLIDLRLEPYAVGGKMLHVVEMEDSTSASREITVEMPRCPRCGEEMLFFANASMWICKTSPHCSGTLIVGATISKDQKAQASRESGQKLELVCPLCGHPMEISRGVFVRVVCSLPACGFTLDTRLSTGILRMLHRRGIV